jgi:hypothetical protein
MKRVDASAPRSLSEGFNHFVKGFTDYKAVLRPPLQ